MSNHLVPLPGSAFPPPAGWLRQTASPPDRPVDVTLFLREAEGAPSVGDRLARLRDHSAPARDHLSYEELALLHGPSPRDLAAVRRFAAGSELLIMGTDPASCAVHLRGRVADLDRAFGVELGEHVDTLASVHGRAPIHRGHHGPVHLPAELQDVVVGIAGLTNRPLARPHFLLAAPPPGRAETGFSPSAIAAAYGVPAGASAEGQTVGIIALGGGYTRADLHRFCVHPSVRAAVPPVTDVLVHGASNQPTNGGDPATADGEIGLDLDTVTAVARGARIRVYFAPNTDRGIIGAVSHAVRDRCTVISISWGAPEALWPLTSMVAFDRTCQSALAMGIPIFAASGDHGSTDGLPGHRSHADFPSSSPHVVGCGGTRLPDLDRRRETAWNDLATSGGAGGGAVSDVWPLPTFQRSADPPASVNDGRHRRTVPDVAANAAPATGYRVHVGGRWCSIGGTSAVAPLMASMAALVGAELGRRHPGARLGDFNSLLYGRLAPGGALQDIADGSTNGGHYFAGPGYDAVTGWGSPNYGRLLELCLDARQHRSPRRPARRPPGVILDGQG